jgi:hypothetical protein
MNTSRQIVRAFMAGGRSERGPLLSLAFYHAARFDGAPFEELVGDPTRLSRALLQQRQLLGGDCVSVHIDEVWFAEAAGASPAWSGELPRVEWPDVDAQTLAESVDAESGVFATLIDVVDRLCKQLRREAPVLVALPGPLLLASRIGASGASAPERLGAMLRDLVERCCRAGAELVLLREAGDTAIERISAASAPIFNTVRYYNATPILLGPERPQAKLPDPALFPAEAAAALMPGRKSGLIVPETCLHDADRRAAFSAMTAALPGPVFLAVLDEALVRHTVEANTEAMRALAIAADPSCR